MGYRFQFITLAGFHALNLSMFELARAYRDSGMSAYVRLQEKEFSREFTHGYAAVKHQRFVGTGYFDLVANTISSGTSSTAALHGSTEEAQFAETKRPEHTIPVGEDPACRPVLGECPLIESETPAPVAGRVQ
jgi:isocitrate lyase